MPSFFEQYPFFIPFISLLMTMVGFVATFLYFKANTKSKRIEDTKKDLLSIEDRAREKLKDDASIAKDVREESKRVAVDTKDEMMEIIHNIVDKLQNDIGRSKMIVESEMSLMKQTVDQVKIDLTRDIEAQQVINDRMEKSLNFVSQFLWGQGAKSIPPYLQGMEETQAHRDEPLEGIYMSPDSSETQAMKDTMRDSGKESTRSRDLVEQRDKEEKRFHKHTDDKKNYIHSISEVEEQERKEEQEKKVKKEEEDNK